MTHIERLQIEVDTAVFFEEGVRGTGKPTDVYPDWVYEARDAIRRQNENPPPWLPDLLAALGWQGGTVHAALRAVRRLVAADKERYPTRETRTCHLCPAYIWSPESIRTGRCFGCRSPAAEYLVTADGFIAKRTAVGG